MSVPAYTEFMLPTLQILADGIERSRKEIAELVADKLALAHSDRAAILPVSSTPLYKSRSGWSVTYLFKAGLLDRQQRGSYQISSEGKALLMSNPSKIDDEVLLRYPSFVLFLRPGGATKGEGSLDAVAPLHSASAPKQLDPRGQLEAAHELYERTLAQDLIDKMSAMPPAQFEQLVIDLLLKMGYGASIDEPGERLGGPGDGGVDGVIKQDRLGLDLVYVQAKRWQGTVGREEIQKFVGSLAGKHAHRGVFITTSSFTDNARKYAEFLPNAKVVLIDGEHLAKYCFEYEVGVLTEKPMSLKSLDLNRFPVTENEI